MKKKLAIKVSKHNSLEVKLLNSNQIDSAIKLTAFLYPYNKSLHADSYKILPYEEYVNDLSLNKKSSYRRSENFASEIFGIFLGFVILIVFAILSPDNLFSVESVVSIFAAFSVGKEIFHDLELLLVNLSKDWVVSYRLSEFSYKRSKAGTLEKFYSFARAMRNDNPSFLASRFEFTESSNSKELSIFSSEKDLRNKSTEKLFLFEFKFLDKINLTELINDGMLGFGLTYFKNYFFFKINKEYFQCLSEGKVGTIKNNKFIYNSLLVRNTVQFGRIKIHLKTKFVDNVELIDIIEN